MGDVNGEGSRDVIAAVAGAGPPQVRTFSGVDGGELNSFFAYVSAFPGGVRVATGDVNGDGRADIITGAGPGGRPHVRVFSGVDLRPLDDFFPFDAAFSGGCM